MIDNAIGIRFRIEDDVRIVLGPKAEAIANCLSHGMMRHDERISRPSSPDRKNAWLLLDVVD